MKEPSCALLYILSKFHGIPIGIVDALCTELDRGLS